MAEEGDQVSDILTLFFAFLLRGKRWGTETTGKYTLPDNHSCTKSVNSCRWFLGHCVFRLQLESAGRKKGNLSQSVSQSLGFVGPKGRENMGGKSHEWNARRS